MKRALWFLFLFIYYSNGCFSQILLTLDKSFKLLEEQNEDLRQANVHLLLGKINVKESRDAFYPDIGLNVSHQYNFGLSFDQVAGQLITGNKWSKTANANISLRTTVFQGMSRVGRLQIALAQLESQTLKVNELNKSLRLEVLTRFFEILTNIALLKTSEKQVEYAKYLLSEEQQKLNLGINTLLDVAQSENQVAESSLNSSSVKNALEISLMEFKLLLGIPITDSVRLIEGEFDRDPNAIFIINDDILNDPSILIAENEIIESELSLKYAKSSYFPSISLYSGYGTNYSSERKDYLTGENMPFGSQVEQNKSFNFGVSLTIPIFDGFKTKNNISKLRLQLEERKSKYNKIRAEKEKVYQIAVQEYKRGLLELNLHRVQKAALERNFNAIKERYEIGASNAMEFNKAQLDLNLSELRLINSTYICKLNFQVLKILFNN